MYDSKESIIRYLKREKEVYQNMIKFLEDYESGRCSIDLKPIEDLLAILENVDISTNSDFTNKRVCQSAIFLDTIIRDLIYLTRNSGLTTEVKKRWIEKLQRLLSRVERLIQTYYDYYGSIPHKFRYYWYWYFYDKQKYRHAPYYSEDYYFKRYPPKNNEKLDTTEIIWKNITKGSKDNESSLFVPRSFLCLDQSQYDEYVFLQLYEALEDKPQKILPLDNSDNDKLHFVADKIISENKQIMKQRTGYGGKHE
jgi:hypothetical protein